MRQGRAGRRPARGIRGCHLPCVQADRAVIALKLILGLWLLVVQVHPLTITRCPIRYLDGGPVVSGPCITWHAAGER